MTKWLVDLITDGQAADGSLPDVAPRLMGGGNAAWEDAGVVCTYRMYEMYGDTGVIRQHWAELEKYMEHLAKVSPGYLRPSGSYGDWLLLDGPQHGKVLGTAYYAYCAQLMSQMAGAIGNSAQQREYARLSRDIAAAFNTAFVDAEGHVTESGKTSQTFYALALGWDLLPPAKRPLAAKHLVALLAEKKNHLATGFIGTPVLLFALQKSGNAALANEILLKDDYPSWLYQVKIGATTMWERWDGWTPEKGFQNPGMNSFNHYWLGCVTEWMQCGVGGLDTVSGGWKRIRIAPEIPAALSHARVEYDSVRGKVVSAWKKTASGGELTVTVPANTRATVQLPSGKSEEVGSGTYTFRW
jgi:alpha-L-rhamnosidase